MGLAINGKVYGTNGVTYIGDNPIDYGYINADGSPKLVSTDNLIIDNFVIGGNYLTNLKKLQSFTNMSHFMLGVYNNPEEIPVLIHVPESILTVLDSVTYTLFAYLCFIIKYGKTDYTKDINKKAKMDKAFEIIYNNLSNGNVVGKNLIQPPENELNDFTFRSSSINAGEMPLPVDEFFAKYSSNFSDKSKASVVDQVFYKGKQVDFYTYNDNFSVSDYNLADLISVYTGGGYGVSLSIFSGYMHRVVFMKYVSLNRILAKYYYTVYDIDISHVTNNGKNVSGHVGSWSFHNYKNIPTYSTPKNSKGDYDIYSLRFLDDYSNRDISFDLDTLRGKDSVYIYGCAGLPYNPDIFLALDINNKYNWFYSGASNMITLPKKADLNMIGFTVANNWPVDDFESTSDNAPTLPLGNYLINSRSTGTDVANAPVNAENITHVEVKWEGNSVLDQIVYTNTLDVYYRRGQVLWNRQVQFTGTYSNWNKIT